MLKHNLEFFPEIEMAKLEPEQIAFIDDVASFKEFGEQTIHFNLTNVGPRPVPVFVNEFWTSKQRAAHSIHEISYRACYKPQLPRFFIERLTQPGDWVYDPFMGRGTTLVEAALMGRHVAGTDVNPLSRILTFPRLRPPRLEAVEQRLKGIDLSWNGDLPEELLVFYHPNTLKELCALRRYLSGRAEASDEVDHWIRMVATNRLTGHSAGFFSVYTLPPNQAVTAKRQKIINEKRNQTPEYRNTVAIMIKKSKSLLKDLSAAEIKGLYATEHTLMTCSCDETKALKRNSVALAVTSPPFLDVVDYASDNWLRCWFNSIDENSIPIWILKKLDVWEAHMTQMFKELKRVLKPGGHIAFEVGEIRNGKIKLEEIVIPAAEKAGLKPLMVLINQQEFTKTSQCWGVDNLQKGTNTNRIVVLQKVKRK